MITEQLIQQQLHALPAGYHEELLDFMSFLQIKAERDRMTQEENDNWLGLSLSAAMRGMEDEEAIYAPADVRIYFT